MAWDGEPLHLTITATDDGTDSRSSASRPLSIVSSEATCKEASLSLVDDDQLLITVPLMSKGDQTVDLSDYFTNSAEETCTVTATLMNEAMDAELNEPTVSVEGLNLTVDQSTFYTRGFRGSIKLNTGFNLPVYKMFMVYSP